MSKTFESIKVSEEVKKEVDNIFKQLNQNNMKNKSCGKTVFFSLNEAKIGASKANHMIRVRKQGGRKLRPYKCDLCGDYHLTSKDPDKYQKIGLTDEELLEIKRKENLYDIEELKSLYGIDLNN